MNRVEHHVGAPAVFEELRHTPGSQLTLRARGPRGSAIVKLYRPNVVSSAAARIAALADGPREPVVPRVLEVDADAGLLLLSDVGGTPLRTAAIASGEAACRRAGTALASWHSAWSERIPQALPERTVGDELATLVDHASRAPREIRLGVRKALGGLDEEWPAATAVHGRLHEETVLIGERVGLIDLDRAAAGPPELDVGSLLAHLDLLALRTGKDLADAELALLDGYQTRGGLDASLLDRCRRLTRLRLALIHEDLRVLEPIRALSRAVR